VHAVNWTSEPMASLYDEQMAGWRADGNKLRWALTIPVGEIIAAHRLAKTALLDEVFKRTGVALDPSVMTIGFARRAATYKRADLVFGDLESLRRIAQEAGRIQFVYAGKAHPHDEPAKDIIRRVYAARDDLAGEIPVVYLEEHDMTLGKLLCAGVDLWLNNPQRPMEASGTSGMKAALNGVPSLSVLDGWWPEGWVEGVTGWSIGDGVTDLDEPDLERADLHNKLNYLIVPMFYGSPESYGRVRRSTIAINGSYFTAQRMLEEYVAEAYTPVREGGRPS
jgi:starch phosphorylase